MKKGYEMTIRENDITDNFDKFIDWIKICYDDIKREMILKQTINKNKIAIDFKIYEVIKD